MTAATALRRTLAALSTLSLLALAACGGGLTISPDPADSGQWPQHGWDDGARAGSYTAVAVDAAATRTTELSRRLRLSVEPDRGGELVRVFGRDVAGSDAWLHLRYDAAAQHPVETQRGDGLPEQCLFMGLPQQPGVVVLSVSALRQQPLPSGEIELAQVRFAPGAMAGRFTAAVTDSTVSDLRFAGNTLLWTYAVRGDYDQNGEVNGADLAPIGAHFRKTSATAADWSAALVADGDLNGEINAADIAPIGNAFRDRLTSYRVLAGPSQTGPFAPVTGGEVPQLNGEIPAGGGHRQYSFEVPSPVDGAWYVVAAVDGATQADSFSNAAQYGGGGGEGAPTNLTAIAEGSQIRLNWNAANPAPTDGYVVFRGSDNAMSDAEQASPVIGVGTHTFLAPYSSDSEHYFGVKAISGTNQSDYSNIAHYSPGGGADTTPPVWQGGIGISSATPDLGRVVVEWFPAIDAQSPPVSYLVYHDEASNPLDEGNLPVPDIIGPGSLSFEVGGLVNGTSYWFMVRAHDSATPQINVTTNTNILFATPNAFAGSGAINDLLATDTASIRMPGEEMPHVVSVNKGHDLNYSRYDTDLADWVSVNLNDTLAIAQRKYHPALVADGSVLHIFFATPTAVHELYGDVGTDPAGWTLLTVASTGINGVYGMGADHDATAGYFALAYASNEQVYYTDRSASGNAWNTPISVMVGQPHIFACDFVINEADGSQWIVASNGNTSPQPSEFDLEFWYATRADRFGSWTPHAQQNTGYGGEEIVVEIDPQINMPVVATAETVWIDVGFGQQQPVSDAAVFTWNGTGWMRPPGTPVDKGDAELNFGDLTGELILTGRDPQIVFSAATGKAVVLYSWLRFDIYDLLGEETNMFGEWRLSDRPETAWTAPDLVLGNICSSNSVTAGESFQHCVTVNLGPFDQGTLGELSAKYSVRNDFAEGDLFYQRQSW